MEKKNNVVNYLRNNLKFKKIISVVSASLVIILTSGSSTKAYDMVSPNPRNLITSPVYSFLEINLWHDVLYNDNEDAEKKLQNWLRKYLEKNLSVKYSNLNFDKLSKDLLKFFIKVYNSDNDIDFFKFIKSFLELLNKYWIEREDSISLMLDIISNKVLPDDILRKIDIDFASKIAIDDLRSYYGEKEFKSKLREVYLLYQKGQLNEEKLNNIFSDYLKYRNIEWKIFLVLITLIFLVWGIVLFKVLPDLVRDTF